MPRNADRQRANQLAWMKRRRQEWFDANGPCQQCGSTDRLEVDHVDPETKITHAVWSWAKQRREKELKKCQVLCHGCHKEKTRSENRLRALAQNWRPPSRLGQRSPRTNNQRAGAAKRSRSYWLRKAARLGL